MGFLGRCAVVAGLCLAAAVMPAAAQSGSPALRMKLGTIEARDLVFNPPGLGTLSIGRIGFSGFVHDGARTRAERIDVDNIKLTAGSRTTEIPSIVITGADLPSPLVRALTAGEPAGDVAGLVASAIVDRIAVARVIQRDSALKFVGTHTDLVLTGLKNGMVNAARLAGSQAIIAGPEGKTGRIGVGEVRYQQFDLAEMIRVVAGGGDGGAKRVLQRIVVDGAEVITDQVTVRIKRIELADVDGRAPAQPLPPEATAQPAFGSPLTAEQQKQVAAYAQDILRHARIGRYSIEGISVAVADQGNIAIGAITFGGFSGRGIERVEIAGLDIRMPDAAIRLDRFELEGIDYGALVEAGLEAATSGDKLDASPTQFAKLLPRLSAVRLSRLDLETPQGPVGLDDMRLEFESRNDGTGINYALRGAKVDLQRLDANEGRDTLIGLGYREIAANAHARLRWLPQERALAIETVGLSLDRFGRLDITARLENVDIDKAFADPDAAEQVLGAARLGAIEIRLADLGFAERFYAHTARSAGLSPDAVRAALAAEMRAQAIAQFGPLLAARSADAIAAFLQSPSTITARIAPAAGKPALTVAELQSLEPPELMQRLTVTLEAETR
jgi:hypothetical protein